MSTAWSPGWRTRVELGEGQDAVRRRLLGSMRHPSRTWHDAPRMRGYGRSPGTAHRALHRLAALGVIALQTTLGTKGGTRFTFGVRRWHTGPVRRGALARFTRGRIPAPGQLDLGLADSAPRILRADFDPPGTFDRLMRAAGFAAW